MEPKTNIAELLENAPCGFKLYAMDMGNVTLDEIALDLHYAIHTKDYGGNSVFYDAYGRKTDTGECLLFPSKDCRTWENFKAPWKHKNFEPFQRVLVNWNGIWVADLYERWVDSENWHYVISRNDSYFEDIEIIPYEGNEDKLGKEVK